MPQSTTGIIYPRRIAPIVFVIDTSGSMSGDRITQLNKGMKESIVMLKRKAEDLSEYQLVIGVLTFSSGAKWITDGLVNIEDFQWSDLAAGGLSDFGAAIKELDDKLCRKKYMNRVDRYVAPTIVCISDGYATDLWEDALESAKANAWIRSAKKFCIAIDEADNEMLLKFCKNEECIIAVTEDDIEYKIVWLHELICKGSFISISGGICARSLGDSMDFVRTDPIVEDEFTEDYIVDETWNDDDWS